MAAMGKQVDIGVSCCCEQHNSCQKVIELSGFLSGTGEQHMLDDFASWRQIW
jgi:hypothetical protein